MSETSKPVMLVIGATGGVGGATAKLLRERGCALHLAARDEARVRALAEELGAAGHVVDARSFEQMDELIDAVVEQRGRLDGIVNCVGSIVLAPAHRTDEATWRETLDTNLTSAFATVRSATRAMARTGGAVVLLSTAAARVGLPSHEAIAAAKAGVIGLALSAAATHASRGVRVNVVAPGMLRTELSAPILRNATAEKASVAMHPLGRLGEAEEAARAVAWLLDPEQSWVTGQVLGVDGGLSTVRGRAAV
jgi:NAD(P)-dependent dehydrogenase (short-subunit alcohol dehydrogenase family)